MQLVNPNQDDINKAIPGGGVIQIKPGTIVVDKPFVNISTPNTSILLAPDQIVRSILHPVVWAIDVNNIAAMSQLNFSGDYASLPSDKKTAVKNYAVSLATMTAVTAAVNACIATFGTVRDSRMLDANPPRRGHITFNAVSLSFPVRWHANIPKGIFTVTIGVLGTYLEGGVFQNARVEGSSFNSAAIRTQAGSDLWVKGSTFQDCEDGVLAGPVMIANPAGEWADDHPPTMYDAFAWNVDENCKYDNCGSPSNGLEHGFYGNNALANVSLYPESVRANCGHFRKFHCGIQLMLGGTLLDLGDSGGPEQCVDMTSGPMYVINTTMEKRRAGNDGAPILGRNDRAPIPPWLENVLMVKGCTITDTLFHVGAFVQAINGAAFAYGWPGVPKPIRVDIENNVFRCPPGSPRLRTPVIAPVGATILNNTIMTDLSAPVPDVRISVPNQNWNRATIRDNMCDLIPAIDAAAKFIPQWKAQRTYPANAPTIHFFEVLEEDPMTIAQLQSQLDAANAQITGLTDQNSTLTQQLANATNQFQASQTALSAERAHSQAMSDHLANLKTELDALVVHAQKVDSDV